MGETTGIAWTDATFSPWHGCTEISPGCDHCYARTFAARFGTRWGVDAARRFFGEKHWNEPRRWNARQEHKLATWAVRLRVALGNEAVLIEQGFVKPPPFRVFCASMADVFDNAVDPVHRERLWQLIRETPALTWQVLTKRIGNVPDMVPHDWPFPHVWLGATVVNQDEAERDIPKLLATPAALRFLSYEPALAAIDFSELRLGERLWLNALTGMHHSKSLTGTIDQCFASLPALPGPYPHGVDWIIVGGESGGQARPCDIRWIRAVVRQCREHHIPVFVKQLGAKPRGWCANILRADEPDTEYADGFCDAYEAHEGAPCGDRCTFLEDPKGGTIDEWPRELRIQEFPEHAVPDTLTARGIPARA